MNQASINIFDLIDSTCGEFRTQWKVGKRPLIEDYLGRVPEQAQANLFKNLLLVEIRSRKHGREQVSADAYLTRFPQFRRLIGDAFYFSTSQLFDASQEPPEAEMPLLSETVEGPPANCIGDYELIRELGRGGFGVVYEARHRQQKQHVALKTLPTGRHGQEANAERLYKFRREFRALADTNHPNLVGMQSLEVDGGQWFFTMDLLRGTDLLEYVRPRNLLDEDRLRAALKQLVLGISALHRQGIIHRDLKPGNIIIDETGHVTILDFGLVAELQPANDNTAELPSAMFAGTPRYAAPEQAHGERSEASDWYALGTMLFEALTGEAPFDGTNIAVLGKKQHQEPPTLVGRGSVTEDLANLTDALLRRDACQRPNAVTIMTMVGIRDPSTIEQREKHDSYRRFDSDSATLFVGRDTQLSQLEEAKRHFLTAREALVVFISGLSGEGKSSLADAFLRSMRISNEFLVLSGRCYDRESVPFKAIDSVIEPLVGYLLSNKGRWLENQLPRDISFLAHLFPALKRVNYIEARTVTDIDQIEPEKIRARGFYAFRELLQTLSLRQRLVILIDDLQWADSDSGQAWCDILTGVDRPQLLFLGSYRSDEVANSAFLQTWHRVSSQRHRDIQSRQVKVTPLTRQQSLDFAASRTGANVESIRAHIDEVMKETGGNPYLLEQLVEGYDPLSGTFRHVPLKTIIDNRLSRLPSSAASLLNVVAVSGQPISVSEAVEVAGFPDAAQGIIARMRSERLVRLVGHGESSLIDTYHDKIRETTVSRLSAPHRQQLHAQLGELIEEHEQISVSLLGRLLESGSSEFHVPTRVLDLVYHFNLSGNTEKTFVYAMVAGEEARKRYAVDLAVESFAVAQTHSETASKGSRYRLAIAFAETLVLRGQFTRASQILDETFPLATSEFQRARIDAIRADVAYKSGSITESVALYRKAFESLKIEIPKTKLGFAASAAWHEVLYYGNRLMPRRSKSPINENSEELTLRLRVIQDINFPLHFRESLPHIWTLALARREALKARLPGRQALADALHGGGISTHFGWYPWAQKHLEPAVSSARTLEDVGLEALCLRLLGYAQLSVGHFKDSADHLEQSAVLFQSKVPDYWQRLLSRLWLCAAYYRLGRMVDSAAIAGEAFWAAIQIRQYRVAQMAIDTWARSTGGGLPFEDLKSCIEPAKDDFTTHIQLLLAECHWHRFNGHTTQALQVAEQAVEILKSNWILNLWTASAIRMLCTTLREQSQVVASSSPTESLMLRSKSLRATKWAVRVTRFLRIEYPAALRERSLALESIGRIRRAERYAKKSLQIAQRQNAAYEQAQSMLVAGRLGRKLRRAEAEEQVHQASSLIDAFDNEQSRASMRSNESILESK